MLSHMEDDGAKPPLETLAERYHGAIFRYFRRKGLDHASAEDCTQDTFFRICRIGVATLEKPEAYLFRIASNVFLEQRRRAKARRDDLHIPIESAELPDSGCSPARIFEGKTALLQLAGFIDELPRKTREVFLLNRLDGLTYTQLATRFGVSVGTIEKQMSRALRHLRARLDQDA